MKYVIEASEEMGFLEYMMSDEPYGKDQATLHDLLQNVDAEAEKNDSQTLSAGLQYNLPKMKSMDDMKKIIREYYGKDKAGAEKFIQQMDKVYPEYDKMYGEKKPELDKYVFAMNKELNKQNGAAEYLEKVGKLFNWDIPKDHEMTGFVYPSYTSAGCSLSKEGGTYQTIGVDMDRYDPVNAHMWNMQKAKWVHEAIHGIFEESGSEGKLMDYLKQPNNRVVKFMMEHPEFRRNEEKTPLESACALFDESITTALQGLFEQEKLGENRKVLYQNPVYDVMAHKMMSILSDMMKQGKTFDDDFIERFENELFDSKTQDIIKEEIKNSKCLEGVLAYLKEQYAKQGKTFPKDFFVPKGHPSYNEEHWQVANELLAAFEKRTDYSSVIDEKFFREFEKNHPETKEKVGKMIGGNTKEDPKTIDKISAALMTASHKVEHKETKRTSSPNNETEKLVVLEKNKRRVK